MTGSAVVAVRGLTKRYGRVQAVAGLDFDVLRGQVCGLLGPNGAGKTTALRMLVGLIRPTAGEARLFDQPVRPGSPELARVGTMIENAAFVPHLSGMRNLRLWWEAGGARWSDADLEGALAVAGLGTAVERRVKTYSQGMRQRLGLARVLLGRPELLLLDEPTNGLDPQEMRAVRELLRRLSDAGVTVLLSSHLLAEIEQVCSHVVVMDRGQLVTTGTVRDLLAVSRSAYFEVGDLEAAQRVLSALPGVTRVSIESPGISVDLDGAARSTLVAALVAAGVAVETVTARHQLEDAFLGLVGRHTERHTREGRLMLRLVGTELTKQVRRPRTWVALGFLVIVPVIIAVALKLNPPDLGADRDGQYFYLATQSGLFLPVAALRIMSGFFLVVVICMFAGDAVASEAGWGNLRYLLVRPVSRGRLLTAKLFVAAVFALVSTALVALSGLVAGVIAFGWDPIVVPFFGFSQSTGDIMSNLALASVLITWGLAGIIAFGFMLSTMTDSAAGAIFGAVGLYIVSIILGEITSLGAIRYGLPVRYYDAWSDLFTRNTFTDDMWRSILLQIPYVLVFCGIAWWWFRRKDVKS